MTATEHATTRTNKLLEKARKEYNSVQDTIGGYKTQRNNAAAEMAKAEAACDLEAYTTARTAKSNAEAALEMYTGRAKKMEQEPLIDRAEYERLVGDIKTEFDEFVDALAAELYDITAHLISRYEEAQAKLRDSNDALHTLQFDLYRGYDLEYNGEHVDDRSKHKVGTREQYDVINWANSISRFVYENMTRERAKND